VDQSDGVAYAVFREERDDQDAPAWQGGDLFVMELRQQRGRWVVAPRGDLLPEIGMVDTEDCRGSKPR
jgi:hypothetical protein